jgi:hypothetical protein
VSETFLIVNGDVVMANGRPTMLSDGRKKVRQDLGEMLSINTQPDGMGAGIISLLGSAEQSNSGSYQNIDFALRDRLTSGTNRFMSLQQKSITNRPTNELIQKIINLETSQSMDDPTTYFWRVDYQTFDGATQTLSGRVTP